MPRKSPHPPEKRVRAVAAYNQLMVEAIPSDFYKGRRKRACPHSEIKQLANSYGVSSETLKLWAKQQNAIGDSSNDN